MVVLAASICTRGGKAVLSRQSREEGGGDLANNSCIGMTALAHGVYRMPRSRVETLLAAFPKLTDAGTQHTTIETDQVRYVYQPLDELYMVLITNRQSNILQDLDTLNLFAQLVRSICKSLDEREILRSAFELLSAFDEIVSFGYRENQSLQQIKTFLEMESHEEHIQDIIARNKEFEASEERKRKAKQLDLQRKEIARSSSIGGGIGRPSTSTKFPTYTPSPKIPDTYDSYEAEKKKSTFTVAPKKGMQLGRKNKTADMLAQVRAELGAEESAPLVDASSSQTAEVSSPVRQSDESGIHVTVSEQISVELARDGNLKSFVVKGHMMLRVLDPSLTKVRLAVQTDPSSGAQFRTHPNVDKAVFTKDNVIQTRDAVNKGFPLNNQQALLPWHQASGQPPINFTVWVNSALPGRYTVTVEYELMDEADALSEVVVHIPFKHEEPSINSVDEVYVVSGDSLDWILPNIDADNTSGAFEFEAQAEEEGEFFPMKVEFKMERPLVPVQVTNISLVEVGESVDFARETESVTENFIIV